MVDLHEIEAIKRLKYRYFRCLDLKLWEELRECFTPDATCAYDGGKYSFDGRDSIMEFLVGAMGRSSFLSAHHGHHPEIELVNEATATGTWALEDTVIDLASGTNLRGAAFYHDDYVKVGGQWKIRHTGYERTFEEIWLRADTPSLILVENRFEKKN